MIAASAAALALAAMSSQAAATSPLDPLPDAGHASFVNQSQLTSGALIDDTGHIDRHRTDANIALTATDGLDSDMISDNVNDSIDLGGADGHRGHSAGT
ncbi:MAG TPA: hypothetical protein VGE48_01910 [Candidatus Paceibacterota bacterium]